MVELLGPLLGWWLWEGTCLFFVSVFFFSQPLACYRAQTPVFLLITAGWSVDLSFL